MLYLIGLGIDSMTEEARKAIQDCKELYLDSYTNTNLDIKKLTKELGIDIKIADRDLLEKKANNLIKKSKNVNIGILISGDVFIATTHYSLYLEALKENVEVKVLHGTSVLNFIGDTGLHIYKFGAIVSIPKDNKNIKSSYEVIEKNLANGWHTLCLLDTESKMSIKDGVKYLLKNGFDKERLIIACSFGKPNKIKVMRAKNVVDFKEYPQCLIIPGELHFTEEEAIEKFK